MMQHEKRPGVPDWFRVAGQILVWAVVAVVAMVFVAGCRTEDPQPRPAPGPTFVREHAPHCGRCLTRPEVGHGT